MDEWFYALNETNQGPVPLATLLQLLRSGQLKPDILVWRDGMPDWLPARVEPTVAAAINGGTSPSAPAPVLGYGLGESTYSRADLQVRYAGF
jgi:type IV pilus assembly protein PilA